MRRLTDQVAVVRAGLSRTGWGLVRMRALATLIAINALTACSLATTPAALEGDLRALLLVQWSAGGTYAGHGFLLSRPGAPNLALTAYHVAGPETPTVGGWLRSPLNEDIMFRLGRRITIAGARTIGAGGSQHDLAAFEVLDWDASRALALADGPPSVGDTVYVLSVHSGDEGSLAGRHPARVAVIHDSAFVYEYLQSKNPNGTSGSAVLDRTGRVVGINVGTLIMTPALWQAYRDRYAPCCSGGKGGEVVGLAVGVRSMRSLLGASPPTFEASRIRR